jgi:hypothetical protein
MTNRSRAWRRRKARLIVGKIKATKEWIASHFEEPNVKSGTAKKVHKVVKPVRAQDLRIAWQLNEDLVDGMTV